MKAKKLFILIALVIASSAGAIALVKSFTAMDVFTEQGPRAAQIYGEQEYMAKRDFKTLFNLAWSTFAKGELARAEGMVSKILYQENWDLSEKVKADCHYLLGIIHMRRGEHPEAISSFFRAKALYLRINNVEGVQNINNEYARLHYAMGDYRTAAAILDEIYDMAQENGTSLLYYYTLSARLAFEQSDYNKAYTLSKQAYQEAQMLGDVNHTPDVLSEMGFYAMAIGEYEEGYELSMQAQQEITALGDDDLYLYNLINFIIYERCTGNLVQGKKDISYIQQINAHISKEQDENLSYWLEFAISRDCDDNVSLTGNLQGIGEGMPAKPPPSKKD